MVKEKLTLSVDKEVVEKAKKLGINISDITEKVLKGYTSAQKPGKERSLSDGYQELFDSIIPLLKEFDVNVVVANGYVVEDEEVGPQYPYSIYLESDGSFWQDIFESSFTDIKKIKLNEFLSPKKILANLVDALVRSKQTKEEKLKEILMAKRIIDAMTETLSVSAHSREKNKI